MSNRRMQFWLQANLVAGLTICALGFLLPPALAASRVDGVLTPDELLDPQLRKVVMRTAEHQLAASPSTFFGVLGGGIAVLNFVALLELRRQTKRGTDTE